LVDCSVSGVPRLIALRPAGVDRIGGNLVPRDGVAEVLTTARLIVESMDPDIQLPIVQQDDLLSTDPFAIVELHVSVTFEIFFCCGSYFWTPTCDELCLDIKVAAEENVQVILLESVRAAVNEANDVLGCDPPGQCCIRLRIAGLSIVAIPQIPLDIDGTSIADIRRVTEVQRSKDCYNVYFVRSVGGTGGGTTLFGSGKANGRPSGDGSVIDTRFVFDAEMQVDQKSTGRVLAHELGHGLGLPAGDGTEPNGVEKHSSDPNNVMSGVSELEPPGAELNLLQCQLIRSSPLLKSTVDPCRGRPRGQVTF
jgi:hypothetical protein